MYRKSANAVLSAVRMLFRSWTTLPLMIAVYAALLLALYLFISTREATIAQLIVTFSVMLAAPLLFFMLQAASVNYATNSSGLLRKTLYDCVKLIAVSLPVIAVTFGVVYLVGKLQGGLAVDPETSQPSSPNVMTALIVLRYLLIGVVAPLVTIQLWIATSTRGLREMIRNLRETVAKAFAPPAVFIFACGFLFFAVLPYFLLVQTMSIERAWLEVSVLTARVVISALLVLLGWVTTVGAISILNTSQVEK
ncbi:MAG TPA: hypothetical protein VFS76_06400 [Pyrinomonadaceae bacterium]|nr:hypothetical protein [Pyrinomonadaceae bacterium]